MTKKLSEEEILQKFKESLTDPYDIGMVEETMKEEGLSYDEALKKTYYIEGITKDDEPFIKREEPDTLEEIEAKIQEIVNLRGYTREDAKDYMEYSEMVSEGFWKFYKDPK